MNIFLGHIDKLDKGLHKLDSIIDNEVKLKC